MHESHARMLETEATAAARRHAPSAHLTQHAACRKGAVIAMGCASAQLMVDSFYDRYYLELLRTRWGMLLEVPYPDGTPPLRHGTMDVSLMGRAVAAAPEDEAALAPPPVRSVPEGLDDVSFTACTSSSGSLLLGAPAPPSHTHSCTDRPCTVWCSWGVFPQTPGALLQVY